jgi:hypothetical protein
LGEDQGHGQARRRLGTGRQLSTSAVSQSWSAADAYISPDMRSGLFFVLYLVVGVLVAAGIVGSERDYLSGLSNLEETAEMILAVVLWPLVLLGVNINIGDINIGGDSGGAGSGGGSAGAAGGGGK